MSMGKILFPQGASSPDLIGHWHLSYWELFAEISAFKWSSLKASGDISIGDFKVRVKE